MKFEVAKDDDYHEHEWEWVVDKWNMEFEVCSICGIEKQSTIRRGGETMETTIRVETWVENNLEDLDKGRAMNFLKLFEKVKEGGFEVVSLEEYITKKLPFNPDRYPDRKRNLIWYVYVKRREVD